MAALRSPARNLSAPKAEAAGSGASLANRITLRLERLSLPVEGPAGAVWGGAGALPKTLLRSGVLRMLGDDGAGAGLGAGGWALAMRLGGSGLGAGAGAACASVCGRGAARATVRRVGMRNTMGPLRWPG